MKSLMYVLGNIPHDFYIRTNFHQILINNKCNVVMLGVGKGW